MIYFIDTFNLPVPQKIAFHFHPYMHALHAVILDAVLNRHLCKVLKHD